MTELHDGVRSPGSAASPDITVFIPVRNGTKFIRRTIESVLGQTFRNLKLVVADNCSTDGTPALVEEYMADGRVTLLRRSHDVGMVGNFNACLDTIDTRYYLTLCHDDYLLRDDALAKAFDILERHPDVPVVYGDMVFVDESERPIAKKRFGYSGLVASGPIARKSLISGRNLFSIPVLIRSSAATRVRYDEKWPNCADVDFSIALGASRNVYYIPEFLVANRFHRSNSARGDFTELEGHFRRIAAKQSIPLSPADRMRMRVNHWMVMLQKSLFFFYLDTFRK